MLQIAHTTGGNHRNAHRIRHRTRSMQGQSRTVHTIAIHTGEQNHPRPAHPFAAPIQSHQCSVPLRPPVNTSTSGIIRRTFQRACINWPPRCTASRIYHRIPDQLRLADCEFHHRRIQPALSKRRISLTLRTPPTRSWTNTCEATSSMMCKIKSRSSEVAVMSKSQLIRARSLYRRAISTGSPHRATDKVHALTTRPAVTSKQG